MGASVTFQFCGKKFSGRLGVKAIKNVEALSNQSLLNLVTNRSVTGMMLILEQAYLNENQGKSTQDLNDAMVQEVEEGEGLEALSKACSRVVEASGILGQKVAAEARGNGDSPAA